MLSNATFAALLCAPLHSSFYIHPSPSPISSSPFHSFHCHTRHTRNLPNHSDEYPSYGFPTRQCVQVDVEINYFPQDDYNYSTQVQPCKSKSYTFPMRVCRGCMTGLED